MLPLDLPRQNRLRIAHFGRRMLMVADGAIPYDTVGIPLTNDLCNAAVFGCGCSIY